MVLERSRNHFLLSIVLILCFSPTREAQRVLQSTFGNTKTYEFGYTVDKPKFKNDFGHYESKRLDGVVRGQYHVLLPDGRVQLVVYYADETGYHPTITYLSQNDWNLIKNGRLALPLLRNRLRQNFPFDPRTQDGSANPNGLPNRLQNPRLRGGPSTSSPFNQRTRAQQQPFGSPGNNGLRRRQPASLRNGAPSSTRSPFLPTTGPRFPGSNRGRSTTLIPNTRFPTRKPFSNGISTTPGFSGSRRPFLTTRGSLRGGNERDSGGFDGGSSQRFRPSTKSPFRRNVRVQNRNNSADSTPVYYDNSV